MADRKNKAKIVEYKCVNCGQSFSRPPYRQWLYCGRACALERIARNRSTPVEKRFWPKVDKTDGHGPAGDCWIWTASTDIYGYGIVGVGGRNKGAHRASWEIHNGPIPEGLKVLHHCDNPPCVRPNHLFLGTQKDNMDDMNAKGRRGKGPAKLTVAQALEIRQLYATGKFSCYRLSLRYGVCRSAVSHVVNRRNFRNLP